MRIYFIRHAQSAANVLDVLAGQSDYPLSEKGLADAEAFADRFCSERRIDLIYSSPLSRALQTAAPFAERCRLEIRKDARLIEQDVGIFTGWPAKKAEAHPSYQRDKSKRWEWNLPEGESYRMVAERVLPFFSELESLAEETRGSDAAALCVTHAVTLRIIVAALENTLPATPTSMARNGEILSVDFEALGKMHRIDWLYYGE